MPALPEPTDADLAARFHPLFARIGRHAVERERERELAHEELAWLRAEGVRGAAGTCRTRRRTPFSFVEDRRAAQRVDSGEWVQVVTSATAPGVVRLDDYAGFGQRTSASGTTTFTDVRIDPADVIDAPEDEYRGHLLGGEVPVFLSSVGVAPSVAAGRAR